jgi:hypothetical protein
MNYLATDMIERDYSPFCHAGATYRAEYVSLPTGVELLTVEFAPPEPAYAPVISSFPDWFQSLKTSGRLSWSLPAVIL